MTESTLTHAPSHLREQFQEWLDSHEPDRLREINAAPVAPLLDALADCGDVLPADYCYQLEIAKGSTYAEAVRHVRRVAKTSKCPEIIRLIRETEKKWEDECFAGLADGKHGPPLVEFIESKELEELKAMAWELTETIHKERLSCKLAGENTPFLWECLRTYDSVCCVIGDRLVTEKYKDRLERHEQELALIDAGDADSLYEEGFVNKQGHREYRRWFGSTHPIHHCRAGL